MGRKYRITVSNEQAEWLTRCIGASTYIYNAKTGENEYYYSFAKKFVPINKWGFKGAEYDWVDRSYSRYRKGNDWLNLVPFCVLRNTAHIWYETFMRSLKGDNRKPNFKNKNSNRYAWFTSETFRFDSVEKQQYKLFLGQKGNNIGYLPISWEKTDFKKDEEGKVLFPKSIWIKPTKFHNKYTLSFSYEDGLEVKTLDELRENIFDNLKNKNHEESISLIEGMDRGVTIPAQTTQKAHVWNPNAQESYNRKEARKKRYQRRLARQQKGSNRRKKNLKRVSSSYQGQANIRKNENHHISKSVVSSMEKENKVALVMENLFLEKMTVSAKGTIKNPGTNVSQKSVLNKSIRDRGLGQLSIFLQYKLQRKGMALFKVDAYNTSKECSDCGNTQAENRPSQEEFRCVKCGYHDNADHNAALVIRKRAVNILLDSRAELGKDGLLKTSLSSKDGRGNKPSKSLIKRGTTRQKRQSNES